MTAAHDIKAQAPGAWRVETRPVPAAVDGQTGLLGSLAALFSKLTRSVSQAIQYRRTYAELAQLDDRTLADVGITRGDIPAIASGIYAREASADYTRGRVASLAANHNTSRNIAA